MAMKRLKGSQRISVDAHVLAEIVRRIVKVAQPDQIILIGTLPVLSLSQHCGKAKSFMSEKRFPPDDPREKLTRYAVVIRYPGFAEPVGHEEYEEAITIAETVIRWAERVIGPE